ncbi:MAG: ABC transporter ATP-binding protein [bacterium]|nr:ABC transporter ATP-binding protein [bacterium]
MKLAVFLWRYFRRYSPWAILAIGATLVFAVSTVVLLALFRPILSEVLHADDRAALVGNLSPVDGERSEGFDLDLDLAGGFEHAYHRLKAALGVNPQNVMWFLPLLFAAVFLLRGLAAFGNGYLFQLIGLGATNDLRNALYERILHQSSRFYARHPSGELVSRVGNDIAVMQNAVSNRLLDLFQQSLTLVLLVWYLLSTHFRLALICLVMVPLIVYPIVLFGQGMRRTSRRSQERLADLSNLVAEGVRGHRVVKAFGMEGFELRRFREAARRHLRVKLRAQLLNYGSGPVVESLAALGAAGFLIYAGHTVRTGQLTPSEVVTFLTNLILLYDPVRKLNKVNLILQEALAAAQRVADVMAIPNDVEDCPAGKGLGDGAPRSWSQIRFENVAFSYDTEPVLQSIDLCIHRGEVLALVGASGAGKSTLVNLLPRFFDPTSGRVMLGEVDLRDMTLASLRSRIGIVTQETVLFNDTIRNNIAYGRSDLSLERVREAAAAAYADEFIEQSPEGYDTVIGEGGLRLSGGQRQRLAIARALLKDPPILIFDEATSHLDSESEALIQKALYHLVSGRTALVIAHRLSTIKRADRILVIEAGRVMEEGTHEDLLHAGGKYQRLYELQFRDV